MLDRFVVGMSINTIWGSALRMIGHSVGSADEKHPARPYVCYTTIVPEVWVYEVLQDFVLNSTK